MKVFFFFLTDIRCKGRYIGKLVGFDSDTIRKYYIPSLVIKWFTDFWECVH